MPRFWKKRPVVAFTLRVGEGEYDGRSVAVLPVRVRAESEEQGVERTNELLDALDEVVGEFEWAEVLRNPRDCLDACRLSAVTYERIVVLEAAEGARNQ